MAKPRSVALKTAEDPGREGFAAEGSIGHIATGREQERTRFQKGLVPDIGVHFG